MSMEYLEEIGILGRNPTPIQVVETTLVAAPAKEAKQQGKEPKLKAAGSTSSSNNNAGAGAAGGSGGGSAASKPAKQSNKNEASMAESADAATPFVEKSAEELAKLTKEERKAYHQARIASQQANGAAAGGGAAAAAGAGAAATGDAGAAAAAAGKGKQLTKAERRELQEAQRKAKEDQKAKVDESDELLKDLKMQGLNESQAREVMKAMKKANVAGEEEEDEDDEDDVLDLTTSVRRWMKEQENVNSDSLHDFTLKVRFQGHGDTLPPDHLRSLLLVLVGEMALAEVDLSANIAPAAVSKKAEPFFERWSPMLEAVYGKIRDALQAQDIVVQSIVEGVAAAATAKGVTDTSEGNLNLAAAEVGCYMAVRGIDLIEDEDLLIGLKRLEKKPPVLDKFMQYLEESIAEEEDSSADDDDE
mmetsp:Transcript_2127/g.2773  ORF Transcript_2127/g.2773 Transcript_2127/m.2773 type:complete len:418 (+) Transcript_2127:1-1254(+)